MMSKFNMKTSALALGILLSLGAGVSTLGCGGDDNEVAAQGEFSDAQIIKDFADQVVVPTYTLLNTRAEALVTAVNALAAAPSEAGLTAAQDAWKATRVPWEQSEGFLFGPVDSAGIDPAIDSWPVERAELDSVIASSDTLTVTYVASLDVNKKGFHAVEYLLFGPGNSKKVEDFTEREFAYLTAAAGELQANTEVLVKGWTEGLDGGQPYREVFVTAGEAGNTVYPSLDAAAQEIIEGMVAILDEVAQGKIGDPYSEQDTLLVESQFAFNSLTDFKDNIRSVQNAYLGKVDATGTSGRGLTTFVAAQDPALDTRVRAEITASLDALNAIAEPFRDAITDPAQAPKIENAQATILSLMETLEGDVKALIQ